MIRKWVAALRSGKYKQGQDQLRPTKDTFCCLGVLCDLHRKERGGRWTTLDGYWYSGAASVLPWKVTAWAGLPGDNPKVEGGGRLGFYNDSGKSFKEIADLIEREFLERPHVKHKREMIAKATEAAV